MATLIKASRLGIFIAFSTLDRQHGHSRKLLVSADALWIWLNNLYAPLAFSASDYGDALRFAHGPDGIVLAQFTSWNFTDNNGSIAGYTTLAELSQRRWSYWKTWCG